MDRFGDFGDVAVALDDDRVATAEIRRPPAKKHGSIKYCPVKINVENHAA